MSDTIEADLEIGPSAIEAYSRLSYTMWHALAEFIDNSTQSRLNYGYVVDEILQSEGSPLVVQITHDRLAKTLTIEDNSIGMTKEDLIAALKIARPTKDSKGRSKYGMGMKTAACWIGRTWKVVTCEWGSCEEWTATVDVNSVAAGKKIPLTMRPVEDDKHYTKIVISSLQRNFQKRTEETIRWYLGSMYRFDLSSQRLKIVYNNVEIPSPADYDFDTDPSGKTMKMDLPDCTINGKKVRGWIAVLKKGGRKFGGFSLFANKRQIQGFPYAWKPTSIFGGVDDEGANNLVSQRLTGEIELDGFEVSHTKDAVLFQANEEEELEKFLIEASKDYKNYAQKRRGKRAQTWSREKVRDLLDSMKTEFTSAELKDTLNTTVLPPVSTIIANNEKQRASLTDEEKVATLEVLQDLRVIVSMQERSEWEPHLNIVAGAEPGTIHVIINGLHPYYSNIDSPDAIEECIRQYIYDAIAEYRVSRLTQRVTNESVRRLKNDLLKAQVVRIENAAASLQERDVEAVITGDNAAEASSASG